MQESLDHVKRVCIFFICFILSVFSIYVVHIINKIKDLFNFFIIKNKLQKDKKYYLKFVIIMLKIKYTCEVTSE